MAQEVAPPLVSQSTVSTVGAADIFKKSEDLLGISPCQFQVLSCDLQLRGEHSILISPTGSGKSLTCFLPFIWQKTGITLLICPLQLLGEQHSTSSLLEKLGVKSVNLTALTANDSVFTVSTLSHCVKLH
jgi:superfamily II DNA helicase RecQ